MRTLSLKKTLALSLGALALVSVAAYLGVNEAQFYASRSGTHTLYVDTSGNDNTAVRGRDDLPWRNIEAAATNAVAGDTVVVKAGNYACSNNIDVPNNANLTCASGVLLQNYVNLTNSAASANGLNSSGPLIIPGTNSVITGALVTNVLKDLIYQACFGTRSASGNKPYWNAQFVSCAGLGDSDVYYVNHSNGCFATLTLCFLSSKWDAMAVNNLSGALVPTHKTILDRTRVYNQGPSLVNPSGAADCYVEGNSGVMSGQLFCTNSYFYTAGGGGGSYIMQGQNSGAKTFDNCIFEAGTLLNSSGATVTLITPILGQSFNNFIQDGNAYNFVNTSLAARQIVDASGTAAGIEFRDTDFFGTKTWSSFIGGNSTFSGYVQATNGFIIRSNSMANLTATINALLPGDTFQYSTNGVCWGIAKSPSGVLTTNKLFP